MAIPVEEIERSVIVYHNPEHEPERVEEMRSRVRAARARFDARIAEMRGRAGIDARQRAVLDRYAAASEVLEADRMAAIAGTIDAETRTQLELSLLFGETNWAMAEAADAAIEAEAEQTPVIVQITAREMRFWALEQFAESAVRRGNEAERDRIVALIAALSPRFREFPAQLRAAREGEYALEPEQQRQRLRALEAAAEYAPLYADRLDAYCVALLNAPLGSAPPPFGEKFFEEVRVRMNAPDRL